MSKAKGLEVWVLMRLGSKVTAVGRKRVSNKGFGTDPLQCIIDALCTAEMQEESMLVTFIGSEESFISNVLYFT